MTAKPAAERRRDMTETPSHPSWRTRVLPGVAFLVLGVLIASSGWLPWFRSALPSVTSQERSVNGFQRGAWLADVPAGRVLLVVGLVIAVAGVLLALGRVGRPRRVELVIAVLGIGTAAWVVGNRFYVHNQYESDLSAQVNDAVTRYPQLAEEAKAALSTARFDDRYGILVAVVAATLAGVFGVWRFRRSTTRASDAA